jgi:hypothetical protein
MIRGRAGVTKWPSSWAGKVARVGVSEEVRIVLD